MKGGESDGWSEETVSGVCMVSGRVRRLNENVRF